MNKNETSVKVKCCACNETIERSAWKKAEVINNTFVGGCPVCHGEFYEEIK